MSGLQAGALPSMLPFADRVHLVGIDEPFRWLRAGWSDFRRSRGLSSAYAFVFLVVGLCVTAGLAAAELEYLIAPLTSCFLLVGPAIVVGFYAISREIEDGRAPELRPACTAWRANPGALFAMGLAQVLFLMVWLRLAVLVFAVSYPEFGFDWHRAAADTMLTARGLGFLAVGTVVGTALASVAFMVGCFSLPLMLDRRIGLLEAVVTSFTAVVLNARVMVVWAGLILASTIAGLASWYLGLCITLPLIGHATWHAYRAVIREPV